MMLGIYTFIFGSVFGARWSKPEAATAGSTQAGYSHILLRKDRGEFWQGSRPTFCRWNPRWKGGECLRDATSRSGQFEQRLKGARISWPTDWEDAFSGDAMKKIIKFPS